MTRTIAILAGGLGTRVASLTGGTVPKAMLPVGGVPFIDHKLAEVNRLGADRAVLLLGHGAEQIVNYLGDGSRFSLELDVLLDGGDLLGTGGALKRARSRLGTSVWVTYGDTLLDADLGAAENHAALLGCRGAMTVLRNSDRWEPSNTTVENGRVVAYAKGDRPGTHEYIDYGYLLIPVDTITEVPSDRFDLAVVVASLIANRDLSAFEVHERFHDIGTPEALAATDEWLRSQTREELG